MIKIEMSKICYGKAGQTVLVFPLVACVPPLQIFIVCRGVCHSPFAWQEVFKMFTKIVGRILQVVIRLKTSSAKNLFESVLFEGEFMNSFFVEDCWNFSRASPQWTSSLLGQITWIMWWLFNAPKLNKTIQCAEFKISYSSRRKKCRLFIPPKFFKLFIAPKNFKVFKASKFQMNNQKVNFLKIELRAIWWNWIVACIPQSCPILGPIS